MEELTTEQKIIQAANKIFTQKGYAQKQEKLQKRREPIWHYSTITLEVKKTFSK